MHVCITMRNVQTRGRSYIPATLAYAAGLNRRWNALIMYSGKLETATMIATLTANRLVRTKDKSGNQYEAKYSHLERGLTEISWQ
jgi:hypothetical protein